MLFVTIETKDIPSKYIYTDKVIVVSLTKPTFNYSFKTHTLSVGIHKGLVFGEYLLCDRHDSFEISIIIMIYYHMLGILNSQMLSISLLTKAIAPTLS